MKIRRDRGRVTVLISSHKSPRTVRSARERRECRPPESRYAGRIIYCDNDNDEDGMLFDGANVNTRENVRVRLTGRRVSV